MAQRCAPRLNCAPLSPCPLPRLPPRSPTLAVDVVCCQVSDLDDEMIFYLQARGLTRFQARSLLLEGWARSALAKVPSEGAKTRAASKAGALAPEGAGSGVRRERLSSI